MFILYAVLVGLAVGFLLGERPAGIATLRLRWSAIPDLLRATLDGHDGADAESADVVVEADRAARAAADALLTSGAITYVDVGSHDQLMQAAGTYAELYGIQAAAYR